VRALTDKKAVSVCFVKRQWSETFRIGTDTALQMVYRTIDPDLHHQSLLSDWRLTGPILEKRQG
jgi:hypothetical protein